MSKSFYKITHSNMARRVFRRTKSAELVLSPPVLEPMALCDNGLDELFATLSQDNFENFSNFRMETNLLRANAGQDAIDVKEALLYLKPCQFQCSKALEVYKNYQKSRESFQLSNLRPYREPLCSGIGTNKMEVVGTQDSEGYPIVLFTVSRHETFRSDHKADMQLLFYTLDQVSLQEAAQEKGIVFIIDCRDSQVSDIRYTNNVVSVLKDGYPIHTKDIYIVTNKHLSKVINALQKLIKHDHKVKFIDFEELSQHFPPEQLPLSLGGSFVPQITSPSHSPVGVSKDDLAVGPRHSPPQVRRGSDGSRTGREARRGPSGGPSGGKSVNKMLGLFEKGHGSQPASKPLPPPSPSKVRPIPPVKPTAGKKVPTQPLKKLHDGDGKTKVSTQPSVQPLKKLHDGDGKTKVSTQPSVQPLKKLHDGDWKTKVPLLPPNGRIGAGTPVKPSPLDSHAPVKPSPLDSHALVKPSPLDSHALVKPSPLDSHAPVKPSPLDSHALIKPSPLDSHAPIKPSPLDSHKQGSGRVAVVTQKKQGSSSEGSEAVKKKMQKLTNSKSQDETSSRYKRNGIGTEKLSTSCSVTKNSSKVTDRKRADSANQPSSKGQKVSSPVRAPRIPPLHPQPYSGGDKKGSADSAPPKTITPPLTPKKTKSGYENVQPAHVKPHPQSPPKPLIQDDVDYENLSFSNRDSDVYENIGIGFAGTGGDNVTGPLPPLPLNKNPARQLYENVKVGKSAGKERRKEEKVEVMEDDDTLFGKEGPPGMMEMIYENFGPDKGNRAMTIEELADHVEKLGKKGLSTEYYRVRNEPITGLHKACRLPGNTPKNRYKDVICYDETRVHLKGIHGQDDYIHANYVDGFKKPKAFILTQGPKDKTVVDFWSMIWEEQVAVIVMVTRCVELGKRKCAQYWPESDSGSAKHGHYSVTVAGMEHCQGYDVKSLKLTFKGVERTLMHFQFLAWPDYGIPSSGSSILNLIFAVREAKAGACQPIVVHCSAGVGRSGAFCTIDNCIHEMDTLKKVNLQGTVRKMRKQRAFAVQTEEQYEFCYQTLLEYAKR